MVCDIMNEGINVSARAAAIEYAIRDVVVPALELEKKGIDTGNHETSKI